MVNYVVRGGHSGLRSQSALLRETKTNLITTDLHVFKHIGLVNADIFLENISYPGVQFYHYERSTVSYTLNFCFIKNLDVPLPRQGCLTYGLWAKLYFIEYKYFLIYLSLFAEKHAFNVIYR